MPREKYEPPNPRRAYTIMTPEEIAAANKKQMATNDYSKSAYGWYELEVTGSVKNLSPDLFQLSHLTVLYLNDNNLTMVPSEITCLSNLMYLDLSSNKLRFLPPEIGDLIKLRELHLNHNYIRTLPLELGRLFQLVGLGLKGNPLAPEILHIYSEANGTSKLLTYLLDNLMMIACHGTANSTGSNVQGGHEPNDQPSTGGPNGKGTHFVPSLLQDPIPPRAFIPISVAKQRVLLQEKERAALAAEQKKAFNADATDGFYPTGRMNYISAFTSPDGDGGLGPKNESKKVAAKPDFFAIADREEEKGAYDSPDYSSCSGSEADEPAVFLGPEVMRVKAAQRLRESLKKGIHTSFPDSSSSTKSDPDSDSESGGSSSDFDIPSDHSATGGSPISSSPTKVGDDGLDQNDGVKSSPRRRGEKLGPPADNQVNAKAEDVNGKAAARKRGNSRRHKASARDEELTLGDGMSSSPNNTFTLMCYNILCDKYATRQLYGYCPTWAMAWDYRRELIRRQLESYAADILCLQEVETDQYHTFFLPQLRLLGYEGIFAPKSRAKTMREDERRFVDGCAIFYKTRRFELVRSHVVEFNQLAIAKAEGSENMLNRVMTKDNIGLTALLRTVHPKPRGSRALIDDTSGEEERVDLSTKLASYDNLVDEAGYTKGGTLRGINKSGAKDDLSLLDLGAKPNSAALKPQDRVKSMGDVKGKKNGLCNRDITDNLMTASPKTTVKELGDKIRDEVKDESPHPRHKRRLSETIGIQPATADAGSIISLPLNPSEELSLTDFSPNNSKSYKVKRSISMLAESSSSNKGSADGPDPKSQSTLRADSTEIVAESPKDLTSTPSNFDTSASQDAPKSVSAQPRQARKKNRLYSHRPRPKPNLLVVSTAHIHWDPEYSDVKIIQAMMIVHELKHFIRECYETYCLKKLDGKDGDQKEKRKHKKCEKAPSSEHIAHVKTDPVVGKGALSDTDTLPKNRSRVPHPLDPGTEKCAKHGKPIRTSGNSTSSVPYRGNNLIPLILCGDLNSLPESGVLEFLLTGRIEVNHADFKDLGYKACLAKLTCDLGDTGHYTHSFKLASAYKPNMMPYTNFTYDFCGVLDYILHSKKFLEAKALLGPLDQDWIARNKIVGAPHPNIPSDHFPVMVEYAFKDKPTHSRPPTHMDMVV